MAKLIQIHPADCVAVALAPIVCGECVTFAAAQSGDAAAQTLQITATEDIPSGHKIALRDITQGSDILKYGFAIGHATTNIAAGQWVHTHNVKTNLAGEIAYTYDPAQTPAPLPAKAPEPFMGYRRTDGRVAIRNELWIIPTVGCVNDVAKAVALQNQHLVGGSIDGLYAFPHPYGCSQTGHDHAQTRKLLAALAKHPNAGGVLVLHLGCENLQHDQFVAELGDFDKNRIRFVTCQEVEDEFTACGAALAALADYASSFTRTPCPVSDLVIGMKCGGSDGLSGITANPVIGKFSDELIARGGATVLTEVPEMFGAEGLLMNRCTDIATFDKAVAMINGFKDYFIRHGEVVYENPSPGNKAGGITTLEDKSCGCVQKGGNALIIDVIGYGDAVVRKGLNMLYGPGNDLVSATAMTAAGAHLILFSTGRGTPFAAPAPTLKLSTNTPLAQKKVNWIDFNTGTVADGEQTIAEAADSLLTHVIAVASGQQTKAEKMGFREISIFKEGVTL